MLTFWTVQFKGYKLKTNKAAGNTLGNGSPHGVWWDSKIVNKQRVWNPRIQSPLLGMKNIFWGFILSAYLVFWSLIRHHRVSHRQVYYLLLCLVLDRNAVLGGNLKNQRNDLSSFPRQTIQYHSNPSLYPNHWCQRSWSWLVLWRPTRPSRNNTKKKKDVLFIIGERNAKVGSQEIPRITANFGFGVQNEAGKS